MLLGASLLKVSGFQRFGGLASYPYPRALNLNLPSLSTKDMAQAFKRSSNMSWVGVERPLVSGSCIAEPICRIPMRLRAIFQKVSNYWVWG